MQTSRLLTLIVALIVTAAVIFVGIKLVMQPDLPLIVSAGFDDDAITPNADGEGDITAFRYTLSRNATVSLSFVDAEGREFFFRREQPRVADDYGVLFSGIVAGYVLPDENIIGDVEQRLLPNGDYSWVLAALAEDGEEAEVTGTLSIEGVESGVPDLSMFSIAPLVFTPNQDGIDDRVDINVRVEKEARLSMYLVDELGQREYITERNEGYGVGEAGAHVFDWDGGIDAGQEPPPDGDYQVVILAEDAEGQRVRREGTLSIRDGGFPIGAIFPQPTGTTVFYDTMPFDEKYITTADGSGELIDVPEGVESIITESEVVQQGDLLVFRLTIKNDGSIGLRTTGPAPGTVYEQGQRASGLGWFDESGAWRVGLECDTVKSSYPWRWAIASPDKLVAVEEHGNTYYYLPAGEESVVWGAVRLTDVTPQRNPQPCWVGLIHEDVAVVQSNIDRRWVEIVPGAEVE